MPGTDERLREAGAEWRRHVDAGAPPPGEAEARLSTARHSALDARRRRTTLRRRVGVAAVTVGAAAVVAGVVALAHPFERGWSGGSSASCVPPMIAVDGPPDDRTYFDPPTDAKVVQPGQTVTVSGRYFVTDCYDSGQHGEPPAYRTVRLTLAGGTQKTRLATVHPDHAGAFTVDVEIPDGLAPGLVTLSTDVTVAQDLNLVVVGATPTPSPQTSSSTNR